MLTSYFDNVLDSLVIMGLVPLYALVALKTQLEFFIVAGVYGFHVGSQAALCRQIFSQFIPAGFMGQFFGLYEMTDKGTRFVNKRNSFGT